MRKGRLVAIAATLVVMGSTAIASADERVTIAPEDLPPREPEVVRYSWYGWQTLLVDTGASLLVAATVATPSTNGMPPFLIPALGVYLFGGPAVHGAHHRTDAALGDLTMRIGLPVALGLLLAPTQSCPFVGTPGGASSASGGGDSCSLIPRTLTGALVGMGVAALLDATFIAREPAHVPVDDRTARWTPTLQLSAHGASAALGVTF